MIAKTRIFSLLMLVCLFLGAKDGPKVSTRRFVCNNGIIDLKSVATLELIKAQSTRLHGLIDPSTQTFAWSVEMRSFQGFNSPLQREHFNENYMESNRFPKASFVGKIIEKVDFLSSGAQSVRAKGVLSIHGVEQERIIKTQVENRQGRLYVSASFTVPVADHNIAIPRIVHQKIAEEIQVEINAVLVAQ